MVSLKDYAKETGVTYEAVRQQVKRYRADLEGHIHQQGRTQYLDDAGVAILDSHRAQRPMAIYDADYSREIDRLEKTIDDLKAELGLTKDKLIAAHEELHLSEKAQAKLEAAELTQKVLTEARDEYKEMAEQAKQEADRLRAERDAAIKAAENERQKVRSMSVWQFIKERKKGE